jgi:UDP-N-acetylmuramate dehydrogenase
MNIKENIKIKNYTTLKLGGFVRYFIEAANEDDIFKATDFAKSMNLPIFPLGGGSNVVFKDFLPDFTLIHIKSKGIKILDENKNEVLLEAKAGESFDDLVAFTVKKGFTGLEALSFIPGTVGACPVQNVGAYGTNVSKTIDWVYGFDTEERKFKKIDNTKCHFSYRDSIFKKSLKGRFIIDSVAFRLKKDKPVLPSYTGVEDLFKKNKSTNKEMGDLELIRKTIINIRSQKLPDPRELSSVGSFFKNVFVVKSKLDLILIQFPDMPFWQEGDLFKIPTGFLIDKAGFKGFRFSGVGVYDKNALVLVNFSADKTDEILDLAEMIKSKIKEMFDLDIEIEPEII